MMPINVKKGMARSVSLAIYGDPAAFRKGLDKNGLSMTSGHFAMIPSKATSTVRLTRPRRSASS